MPKCVDCENYSNNLECKVDGFVACSPNEDLKCSIFRSKQQPEQSKQPEQPKQSEQIRQFSTGAYRDEDTNKLDFEACLSPLVLQRYAQYIQSKRKVPMWKDKGIRPDDNWQIGIPIDSYMKSKARHFITTWLIHRGFSSEDIEETLCAEIFNSMGMLFEILKGKK